MGTQDLDKTSAAAERQQRGADGGRERPHPGPKEYVVVAVALALITAVEVGVYYVQALRPALTPILLTLAAAKVSLVALFFMHLKFDSRLFTVFFGLGLGIAAAILLALLALFSYRTLLGG